MTKSHRTGLSLVEILTVISILLILSFVVWLALAPRARRSGQITELKNRFRQLAAAVNLYMIDHDGQAPPSLELVAAGISLRDPISGGGFEYVLSQVSEKHRGLNWESLGFNPAVNSIIKSTGVNDHKGRTDTLMVPDGHGGWMPWDVPLLEPGQRFRRLGVRLDGSIGWFDSTEDWQKNVPQLDPPPPG